MAQAKFDSSRDHSGREVASQTDRALMCRADGCPNRWTCDMGNGFICSAHDRSEPHLWPQITAEQIYAQTDRARLAGEMPRQIAKLSLAQKRALIERMRRVFTEPAHRHAWAHNLLAKRSRGERLSPAQRSCLAAFERRRHE